MRGWTTRDLAGRTFGRWLVLERAPRELGRYEAWRCRCGCGTERTVDAGKLLHGRSKSCGCVAREIARRTRPRRRRDLRGQIIGELTVLRPGPSIPTRSGDFRTAWFCKCACGREVLLRTDDLTRRHKTTHCGCRHLRPAEEPESVTEAPATIATDRTTSAQRALNRFHDEHAPLGAVRRVSWPADDDDGGTLHDFDPWVD
jgi:hypothetical protein